MRDRDLYDAVILGACPFSQRNEQKSEAVFTRKMVAHMPVLNSVTFNFEGAAGYSDTLLAPRALPLTCSLSVASIIRASMSPPQALLRQENESGIESNLVAFFGGRPIIFG